MLIVWSLICYLSGSLPWSVWLGWLLCRVDPREQPDHNPGAANAFRAGGPALGVLVLALDFAKGLLPVLAARWLGGFDGLALLWLALLPMLGHAFSVWLRLHGGRGIAVLFGVWTGLTLYRAPLVMGLAAIGATLLLKRDEYRTLAIPLALLAALALTHQPPWMLMLAGAQLVIILAKLAPRLLARRRAHTTGAAR